MKRYYCFVVGGDYCKIENEEERYNHCDVCGLNRAIAEESTQAEREYEEVRKNDGVFYDGE